MTAGVAEEGSAEEPSKEHRTVMIDNRYLEQRGMCTDCPVERAGKDHLKHEGICTVRHEHLQEGQCLLAHRARTAAIDELMTILSSEDSARD